MNDALNYIYDDLELLFGKHGLNPSNIFPWNMEVDFSFNHGAGGAGVYNLGTSFEVYNDFNKSTADLENIGAPVLYGTLDIVYRSLISPPAATYTWILSPILFGSVGAGVYNTLIPRWISYNDASHPVLNNNNFVMHNQSADPASFASASWNHGALLLTGCINSVTVNATGALGMELTLIFNGYRAIF